MNKKFIVLIIIILLVIISGIIYFINNNSNENESNDSKEETSSKQSQANSETSNNVVAEDDIEMDKILVVYFSAQGHTDTVAHKIAENKDVLLPLMVCQDGFITSHSIENIELIEDEKVKQFVGEYKPEHYLLNNKEPIAVGPMDLQAYLFEHKYQQAEAMKNAKKVILEIAKEFEKMTGRKYGLFEEYKLDDAEIAVVCMNSTAGTTKDVVDSLREKGIKAGMLKVRVFRPFPAEEIAKALSGLKAVAILDKADSLNGAGGALFEDVVSAMYVNGNNVKAVNYIYGIGGRDTTEKEIESVYTDLQEIAKTEKVENPYRYLGLRKE